MARHPGSAGKLSATEVAQCRAVLDQRLGALRAALREQREAGPRPSGDSASVEVHDLKDEAFAGQLANLSGLARDQMQSEVAAVQAALRRIAEGSYGQCEDCDREIGRERLLAQPSAGRCLPCQERAEAPAIKAPAPPRP
jgi:DnaK suppressor protein